MVVCTVVVSSSVRVSGVMTSFKNDVVNETIANTVC